MRAPLLALLLALTACASEPEVPAEGPSPAPTPPPSDTAAPAAPADGAADTLAHGDSILIGDPPTWVPGPLRSAPTDWTVGIVDVAHESGVATLRAVRTGAHEGFVRVVFEFAERVPGYHLEYVDRPVRQCGSGEPVAVAGDAWLEVRLQPAQAHTEAGEATVAERDRRLTLGPLRQFTLTCDFEADVTWVLGLASPERYRVSEAADPPRLVVDVQR